MTDLNMKDQLPCSKLEFALQFHVSSRVLQDRAGAVFCGILPGIHTSCLTSSLSLLFLQFPYWLLLGRFLKNHRSGNPLSRSAPGEADKDERSFIHFGFPRQLWGLADARGINEQETQL